MRIFTETTPAPPADARPAVTMGVFDGVHLGHAAILAALRAEAAKAGAPSLAITFSPHPRLALGRAAPPGICSLDARLARLEAAGLDAVWVLPFAKEFAQTPARAFAEEYFHRRLRASAVVLGATAVFGANREGSADKLAGWAREAHWGMTVAAVPPLVVTVNGEESVVSSTAVRLAVMRGDLDRAAAMLGRPVSVEGTVVHGQGRGHKLGFPTLNLDPHHELRPPPAVYLTTAVVDGAAYPSLTNIGRPPTEQEIEAGIADFLVETHLLDFDADVYGRTAEVLFHEKLRDVLRLASAAGLVAQVDRDRQAARLWFAERGQ